LTPGGVSYRVDRKAFFNLPFETKPQHCQRIFEDFLLASQRLAHSECLPPQGSCNMECTGYVAGDPSWTLTMPVLFLGASNPPGSLPSSITHNLLRPLAPDKLELFKTKILDLVEQAARNEVYISDLRLEHFGYIRQESGIPVIMGLVDFCRVYSKLDDKHLEWYRKVTEINLEKKMEDIFKLQ
jgi:hypothetical protein